MTHAIESQMNADQRGCNGVQRTVAANSWLVASRCEARRTWALAFAIAIASFSATGCSTGAPSDTPFVKDLRAAATRIAAVDVYPMNAGIERFRLQDQPDDEVDWVTFARSATDKHGATIAVAEDNRRVEFLARTADGSIALTAAIDRDENVLTLFEPPLVVMPATVEPDQSFESTASMRVVALDDPSRQRERGTARRIIVNAATVTVHTDSDTLPAARLDVHFTADLRFADADERTSMYVSPERGVLAIRSTEVITILGAFPKTARRTMIRSE